MKPKNPEESDSLIQRANALYDQGEYTHARVLYEDAIEIVPGDFRAVTGLAKTLLLEGCYADARQLYEAAFAAGLEHRAEHFCNLGICRAFDGENEAARKLMQGAVALDAFYEPAYGALAALCMNEGDHQAAYRFANEGLRIFPQNVVCLSYRGQARLALLDVDGADADAERALRIEGDEIEAIKCKAGVRIVRQQAQEAIRVLEHAQKNHSEDADLLVMLASAYQMESRYDDEYECLLQALESEPVNYAVHQCFGSWGMASGNHEEGLRHVEIALELREMPMLHFMRGFLLRKMGRDAEALAELEIAAKANNPQNILCLIEIAELLAILPAGHERSADVARQVLAIDEHGHTADRARQLLTNLKQ